MSRFYLIPAAMDTAPPLPNVSETLVEGQGARPRCPDQGLRDLGQGCCGMVAWRGIGSAPSGMAARNDRARGAIAAANGHESYGAQGATCVRLEPHSYRGAAIEGTWAKRGYSEATTVSG